METTVTALFLNTFIIVYIVSEISELGSGKHFINVPRIQALKFGLKIFTTYHLFLFVNYIFGKLVFKLA